MNERMQMMAGNREDPRQREMREFWELFPEAAEDPQSIPPEVWEEVRGGKSLLAAYVKYFLAQTRGEEDSLRQNQERAARSTGSMRSADSGMSGKDAFLRGFYGE